MARPFRGAEVLEMAQELILRAQTVDELRQAQAVALPLAYGLTLEQTVVVWPLLDTLRPDLDPALVGPSHSASRGP